MPGKGAPGDVEEPRERRPRSSGAGKSSRAAPKKMVQARLPFQRLNPVPKEKEGLLEGKKPKAAQKVLPQNTLHLLNSSTEDLENDCQMETEELPPLPKTVNGKGPLDHYLTKTSKASSVIPVITIDLTDDNPEATLPNGETQTPLINGTSESNPPSPLPSHQTDQCNTSMETETQEQEHSPTIIVQNSDPQSTTDTHSSKLPGVAPGDGALHLSPAKVDDGDTSADEDSAAPSSTSSPISASSPEAQTDPHIKDCVSPSASITPVRKASEKKQTSEKKRLRDKEQEEKRLKLQAEKEEREKAKEEARLAKERAKEEAKKKKDEEKELKEKERKEKKEKEDQEKAEKLRVKEEKKKEKLEALEAKQEEKRKKDEEKRLKEEEKRVKAEKSGITRFLQKPKTQKAPKTVASFCGKFAPFEIKKNMAVAPLCRVEFEPEAAEQLDTFLQNQNSEVSFLAELKSRRPRRMGSTVVPRVSVVSSEADEVQILEEPEAALEEVVLVEPLQDNVPERNRFGRMKLLQFCENHRPAYWGTWNRKSQVICSRKPWALDSKMLDYEVDSDDEWEEEEPGESLSHSEGDDDDEPKEDDDEDDDGFFVPHGYLSEDEGASDEERTDPENQKVRQKLKAKEWDELLSKGKVRVLQPVVVGCVWQGSDASEIRLLKKFSVCILETPVAEEELAQEISAERTLKDREILSHLLPLLHGNFNGSKAIIHEFQECCRRGLFLDGSASAAVNSGASSPSSPSSRQQTPISITVPSKSRLKRIISEHSVYEKRPDHRPCWYVHAEVLKSFDQEKLPVPCQWTYVTQVNSAAREESTSATVSGGASTQTTPVSGKRKSAGSMSITKFMKRAKDLETAEAKETDGFQADSEGEDDDCMIVEDQQKSAETSDTVCKMEVVANDDAAVPVSEQA
ncbi:chromatin assembly factor 1 subunit A [Discoglossus pictus]